MCLLCILISGCARRERDLVEAQRKAALPKINHLSLPAPRGLSLSKNGNHILLTWFNELPDKIAAMPYCLFVGYNVYRFRPHAFVPARPLNTLPLKKATFTDNETGPWSYLVRGVVIAHGSATETPASQVVSFTK